MVQPPRHLNYIAAIPDRSFWYSS